MGFVSACFLLVFSCLRVVSGDSGFSYASYYESHMVLQRAPYRASIWGYAPVTDVGSTVTVNISALLIPTFTFTTTVQPGVDPQRATWKVTFPPLAISGACTVTAAVLNKYEPIVLNDVLFGDVWVCSGQSNMKFTVSQIFGAAEVAAEAARYANAIRFFSVGQVESQKPLQDFQNIEIHWSVPDKSTVWPFSAVCWLYAKNIYDTRGVPMGLIESSWGGTNVEAWSSPECLHVCHVTEQPPSNETKWPGMQRLSLQLDNTVDVPTYQLVPDNNDPINAANSVLWNAMINPILNMTIFGVIWYQGEANTVYNRDIYNCTFPAMITDWREKWFAATHGTTNAVFPFGFVQIGPTDSKPVIAGYADIRWHQTADFGFSPNDVLENVFMAVSVDLTDFDVHFRDKMTVSRRLALSGLAVAYKLEGLRYQGPWVTMVVVQVQRHLLTLNYDYNKYPIAVKNITGFEICCQAEGCAMDSDNWVAAPVIPPTTFTFSATLNASLCSDLKLASALRYAWRETPFGYLGAAIYSADYNLPAPPFIMYHQARTNKWYHGKPRAYLHDKL